MIMSNHNDRKDQGLVDKIKSLDKGEERIFVQKKAFEIIKEEFLTLMNIFGEFFPEKRDIIGEELYSFLRFDKDELEDDYMRRFVKKDKKKRITDRELSDYVIIKEESNFIRNGLYQKILERGFTIFLAKQRGAITPQKLEIIKKKLAGFQREFPDYSLEVIRKLDTIYFEKINNLQTSIEESLRRTYQASALLSFDIHFYQGGVGVMVGQIQGIKHNYSLRNFKWTYLLLDIVTSWAKNNKLDFVMVQGIENNKWVVPGHLDKDHGRLIYDVTAERSGFKKMKDNNYIKLL